VITGFHARIDPRALGLAITAVIRVRPLPRQIQEVARIAQDSAEVVDCRRITGEDCYIMTAHLRSVEHLEELIDRFTAYGQTTTSIVQSAPVPPRGLSLT
jgi:Lrp/AsnC family leucine-responsive transcriptional regulator